MVNITIISGHYPSNTIYASISKIMLEDYCQRHNYQFYYDDSEPEEKEMHSLHFRRSEIIHKAASIFPDTQWFLWLDSDVYVNKPDVRIESCIDLTDDSILYHTFHENNWGSYPINTGVKFIHRDAIPYEALIWSLRNTDPWNQFPYEQKTLYECIFPQITGKYIIHDPYVLNCIRSAYPQFVDNALFVHLCAETEANRNTTMQEVLDKRHHKTE